MRYSRAFFEVQIEFARTLANKFDLPLADALRYYTTFTKSLGEEWEVYSRWLESSSDSQEQTERAYHSYLTHGGEVSSCFGNVGVTLAPQQG